MPSKRCSKCDLYWPQHHVRCPDCGGDVWINQSTDAMSKEDYDERMALIRYRNNQAPAPDPKAIEEFDAEWRRAEAAAARSGFSVADILIAHRHRPVQ